jgi:threonine dehydrogenase-like Zn-dependent dehydrogenase
MGHVGYEQRLKLARDDPTFLISRRMRLEDAPRGYKRFNETQNEVTKVVLKPWRASRTSLAGRRR